MTKREHYFEPAVVVVVVVLGVVVVVVAFNSCSCSSLFMINKKWKLLFMVLVLTDMMLVGVEQSQEVAVDDTPAIRSVGVF